MRYNFDYQIIEAINNAIRTVKAAPLVLGATSSGGGGPPGGIVGYLAQDRVSFDADELSTWEIPASGVSLVTNLNRIRYRLDAIESGGMGAITFLDLTDTPSSYTGNAGKSVVVNATEDGLEFTTISGGGLEGLDSNRVVITTESGVATTDEGLQYDRSFRALVLGGTSPLTLNDNIFYQVSDGYSAIHGLFTWGTGFASRLLGFFTGGTVSSPVAALVDSIMLRLSGRAYDGSYNAATSAEIRLVTDQDHSTGNHGTRIEFHTTPSGSSALSKAMEVTSSGHANLFGSSTYDIDGVPHTHSGLMNGNGFQVDCSAGTGDTYAVLSGLVNGSNTDYITSAGSYISGSLLIYLNGQLLTQGTGEDWVETVPESGMFSFNYPPVSGDAVFAYYKYANDYTGNADTLDGYEAASLLETPYIKRGVVELDFGTGDITKTVTVSEPSASVSSIITASILCEDTLNNYADEIAIQPLEVKVINRGAGSFDIMVNSQLEKFCNEVKVTYIMMN